MLNKKDIFSDFLSKKGLSDIEKNEIVKSIEMLSILAGIRVYNLKGFNEKSIKEIIKEVKVFVGNELIEKFKIALNFYLEMIKTTELS